MAPKVRAIIAYLDRPGRRGLITDPPNIGARSPAKLERY